MRDLKKNLLNAHAFEGIEVVAELNSHAQRGLTQKEIALRLQKYGPNTLPASPEKSFLVLFFHQFKSPLIYLLLTAALVAYFLGEAKDTVVILAVVLLNAIIGSYQEGKAEQSVRSIRKLALLKTRVLREGQEQSIEASEVVPGDILILSAGDAVPADSRLLEVVNLTTSEAALTGESLPVVKAIAPLEIVTALIERKNMIYAGTFVATGRGKAIVVSNGLNNEIGKISSLVTQVVPTKTQLELRVEEFGKKLVYLALLLFVSVVAIGMFRGISFMEILMIAISQMVSLVPEGLPVALTIALAVGVQRLSQQKSIVRKLSAVEALGSTTVICTDKTGTLTKNEMTVSQLSFPQSQRSILVSGVGYTPEGSLLEKGTTVNISKEKTLRLLFECAVLCNDSQLIENSEGSRKWNCIGDPTEGALLTLAKKGRLNFEEIRKQYPREREIPFDSQLKMMATQHEMDHIKTVFIKGAPENLIGLCGFFDQDGNVLDLTSPIRNAILSSAQDMANQALRVLALAYVKGEEISEQESISYLKNKLIFLGLVGQIDPPREEVFNAIQLCHQAYIKPVMVTGDHKTTAMAIAKQLGIIENGHLALEGGELDKLTDEELSMKLNDIRVFARVLPSQKLRIIDAYQKKGEVVAMTGDGVNDAPALVKADIGIAMGQTGTEVAKEASKVIIIDDNFNTIVNAIAEGRLVYQNIRKLILFLFVTSLDEVILLFLALLFGYPLPLAAVQILWINLVTEGALTINLIMEPAEGNEMMRPPTPASQPLLDRTLIQRMPLMIFSSVVSTFGWLVYRSSQGISGNQLQTEIFTILAFCQWFNVLNCRSSRRSFFAFDLFKNLWLLLGLSIANLLHLLVLYWEPLGRFFHTVPLDIKLVITLIAVSSLVLWTEELRKFFIRLKLRKTLG